MRIVLIEDEPGDVRWLEVMLNPMSVRHDLVIFATGIEALEHFKTHSPPDLILSDWVLPCLDLPDFMHQIRAIPGYASTPIAACSGIAEYFQSKAVELGAICCLTKPIGSEQLHDLFKQIGRSTTS